MTSRVLALLGWSAPRGRQTLDGFVDSLLQMFENCRAGLSDEALRSGPTRVEGFFLELYEKERARLRDTIEQREQHLSAEARRELYERVDERIRKVVIPAYARLAARFAPRERNDFFLLREGLHGLERAGWAVAGIAAGAFAVWAPFIPIWEKDWVLVFAAGGIALPNLRRYLALRRYQSDLNSLVARTDDEIWRLDLAYLTGAMAQRESTTVAAEVAEPAETPARPYVERTSAGDTPERDRPRGKEREGGR